MLSIEQVKSLTGDPNLSDEEAKELRDAARGLALVILDKLRADQHSGLLNKNKTHEQ